MIGVENQYYLSLSIGSERNFLADEDLVEFSEISEAGNALPTFELSFWTSNEAIFGLLQEGNLLQISFGRTLAEARDYILFITSMNAKINPGRGFFHCVGIFGRPEYFSNTKRAIIGPTSGIEAATTVLESAGFSVDTNLAQSEDSQYWVQANWSDRRFVSEILMHSYVSGSFLAWGISSDGVFVLRDVRKMAKETDPVWTFVQASSSEPPESEVVYDPDPSYETKTGFLNYWAGYGQEKAVFSLEDDDLRFLSEDVRPVIALTDQLARRDGMQRRHQGTALQNENVHSNYWLAALQNVTNAAVMGSLTVTLTFQNEFKPVRILDLVSYSDASLSSPGAGSSMAQSGLYVVSKVARTVANKQLVTTVVLCRESVNDVTGQIRQAVAVQEQEQFGVSGTPQTPVE